MNAVVLERSIMAYHPEIGPVGSKRYIRHHGYKREGTHEYCIVYDCGYMLLY